MKFLFRDTEIGYKTKGDGLVAVLLHGFGEDSTIWDEQISALRSVCKLIIPDLPGSGKSVQLSNATGNTTIEDYADVIHALLQHEQVDKCILLGHSMGGYIALAFAEKYPDLLLGLGLVHSTAFSDSDEKKAARKKGIELIAAYGGLSFLKNTIPNLFGAHFKQTNPERVEWLIGQSRQFANETLIQYYTAMMNRPDRTHVLKNSRVPVLFLAGTEDVAAPLEDVLKQVHLPDVAHIHILEGVGHMGMWEDTAGVNRYLLSYILSFTTGVGMS